MFSFLKSNTINLCEEILVLWLMLSVFYSKCNSWVPDMTTKLVNSIGQTSNVGFFGNLTHNDHFTILHQESDWILLGGRNTVYNLSVYDFTENEHWRLTWFSSNAHWQLCQLKGKSEDDCQNYIKILVSTAPDVLLLCGTNSYKPLCRQYSIHSDGLQFIKELDGVGICPYNPDHNNTAVQSNGDLFSATTADFSERDPLIYREPQRTELSDLKQLNAPNFVNSMSYGDYIFFFFRETAVEYINCGKAIYSRVGRVCKSDKGGPHQFGDKWTSFLKARLNCSVPGEYPFYFDEIQSTTNIIEGSYGSNASLQIIYGTLTTPSNAIGGSAICAYSMNDILKVFEGTFKHQSSINSNWLPYPLEKLPVPRPGQCVKDSRVLPESVVNFVKTHSLMEDAVPALFGQPILVRVSFEYRFTSIAVDPQVETITGRKYDILYVGTDNGKVLKIVNIPYGDTAKAIVISENNLFSNGIAVRELRTAPGHGRVIAVSRDEVKLANFNHCSSAVDCQECVALQDPHCAWDLGHSKCTSFDAASKRASIQDIQTGDPKNCWTYTSNYNKMYTKNVEQDTKENEVLHEDKAADLFLNFNSSKEMDCESDIANNSVAGCAVRQHTVIYTAKTLQVVVVCASVAALLLGFFGGYLFSRRFHPQLQYPDASFIEQHNHLERLNGNSNSFLTPRLNKAINLVVNVPTAPPAKKDNLETNKDLNIASDGTLQKIKKTYI